MKNNNKFFQDAFQSFQGGDFVNAIRHLSKMLESDPNHFDSLHMMGVIYGIKENHKAALDYFKKAVKLNPTNQFINFNFAKALSELDFDSEAIKYHLETVRLAPNNAEAWLNFGKSLLKLSQYEKSLASFDKAIEAKPNYSEALCNKGLVHHELKQFDEALFWYDKAIQVNPYYAEVLCNKGVTLYSLNRYDESLAIYDQAIKLKPAYAKAWSERGVLFNKLKLYDQAIESYDRALELSPNNTEVLCNKGVTLNAQKNYLDALSHYEQAIKLNPNYPEAYCNKGVTLNNLKRYVEALDCYDQAIILKPDYAEALCNKAVTLNQLKRFDEALKYYSQAIEMKSDFFRAKFLRGLLQLSNKNFDVGLKDYESRLKEKEIINFEFPLDTKKVPIWDGGAVCEYLLVIAEQGIGDEVFYASFLHHIKDKVKNIEVLVDKRLIKIFSRSFPFAVFREKGSFLNADLYDYQLAIGSLPIMLKLDLTDDQYKFKPFLLDDSSITGTLKVLDTFNNKFTCGIAWKSLNNEIGNEKSIHLSDFEAILKTADCRFVNLQYGDILEDIELAEKTHGVNITAVNGIDIFSDIDGLISIIKLCDVIVTTSNLTAHLAGAIGKKTFLLLPYSKGRIWYWHQENNSTWYPNIKQYYQDKNFSWKSAIKDIANELGGEIARKN